MTESEPPRRRRTGGIRRERPRATERRSRSAEMLAAHQRRGDPLFDPETGTWRDLGKTLQAKRAILAREQKQAEVEWLARHLQLDERGRLPEEEQAGNWSVSKRRAIYNRLTNFPRIPEGELQRLEGIIARYGLPLSVLSSDTAAFVVRRVMMDFHRLAGLRRGTRKGMFTAEELLQLLEQLKVTPSEFGEMVWPQNPNAARGNTYRWLHGVSQPTGLMAVKVNRMIEQQVRRKRTGGFPARFEGEVKSDKPTTVERRERLNRARKRGVMHIPLAKSAQQREDDADATERPDGGA